MGQIKQLASDLGLLDDDDGRGDLDLGLLDDDYIENTKKAAKPRTFPPVRVPAHLSVDTMRKASANAETFLSWCENRTPFDKRYYAEWQDPIDGSNVNHARYRVADWICVFLIKRGEITDWSYTHVTAD